MNTYKLTFECLSTISRIPDAQVIFGAICSIIKYTRGEEELYNYLESFSNKPKFVHSSMFPNNLIPMVKVGLISINEKNNHIFQLDSGQQLNELSKLKQYKKITYMTQYIFEKYLNNNKDDELKFELLKNDIFSGKLILSQNILSENRLLKDSSTSELIFHTNQEEDNDDRGLYYDKTIYYEKGALFNIYVKTDDLNYVKDIFKYSHYFGFGNRISVGKNCFQLKNIEKIHCCSLQSNKCILLSKCIDTHFDLEQSSYMIDSKTFIGSKDYSSNKIGIFNSFVEGSYMKVNEKKEYYGKLYSTNNGKEIYHYGIGFVL